VNLFGEQIQKIYWTAQMIQFWSIEHLNISRIHVIINECSNECSVSRVWKPSTVKKKMETDLRRWGSQTV